ncbi:MAG TPA: GlxA family transcriptional regulator [Sphingomicrobium sp.]|nr:GlxA family transcriptional regulator [Sphingomicrobium sp.]
MDEEFRVEGKIDAVPHHVVMLAYPDAQLLDIAGPLEVFSRAARWLNDHAPISTPAYTVEITAATAGPVRMSDGLEVIAPRAFEEVDRVDTLLVSGGIGFRGPAGDARLLEWLKAQSTRVSRIGSVCTGAMVLAAAGLLSGRRATTHWAYCDELSRMAPDCEVDHNALYISSGNVVTSAGVTAGMDLALSIVEADWGKATALAVAQELVIYRKRPGGQGQFSRYLEAERRDDRFGKLQIWMLDHLAEDLSVERLAEEAGMSERHFSREFKERIGMPPAKYVLLLRVEEARRRLESGPASLKLVARECGFADEQNLRRAFRKIVGVVPNEYRASSGA